MKVAITGGTGFIGKRILKLLLNDRRVKKVVVLGRRKSLKKLRGLRTNKKLVHIESDLSLPFLGIKENERRKLKDITHFVHAGAIYDLFVDKETAYRVNIRGTEECLKIAEESDRLVSFLHLSTIAICGDYKGVFTEDMFDEGQQFSDWYGWSKFESEKVVRTYSSHLPVTIIRPGAVIGETKTGSMDKMDGVYYIMLLLSLGIHFVAPTRKDKPLPIIPVDFLAEFIHNVLMDEESTGNTFFAIEPLSPTLDEFIEIVCREMKVSPPIFKFDIKKLEPLLKPELTAIASLGGRIVGIPYEGLNYILSDTIYNTRKFMEAVIKYKLSIPSFRKYAKNIVKFFLKEMLPSHPLYFLHRFNRRVSFLFYRK